MKSRTPLEGVGAALLLLPYYLPFLDPSNLTIYIHGLPVTHLIGGILWDLLGVAILVTALLAANSRLPEMVQRTFSALFAGLMLWRIADIAVTELTSLLPIGSQYLGSDWGQVRKQSCVAVLLLFLSLACFLPKVTQPVVRAVRLVVAAFAFTGLWIVPQLVHLALLRPTEASAPKSLADPGPIGPKGRIVWILFDELSYGQAFDHRASGLKLPNLDKLRARSLSFSHLKPAGFYTSLIIPSLFLGKRIAQIRSTVQGDLWYKEQSQQQWLAYDPNATLFGLAQKNGWNVGIDGWYNPYCHLFASVVNACSWVPLASPPQSLEEYGASEDRSALANAEVLPKAILAKLARDPAYANAHIREYHDLMAGTQAYIGDDRLQFVFLHLPIPHPPGIYDRERHQLHPGGSYLDNLVLADDTLGTLLDEIAATPSASRTTVIVSSDHSWRTSMWRGSAGWGREDESASRGGFDDRPVLLIQFPGQQSGSEVPAVLPEMLEHEIIVGMLIGKVNRPEDLTALLGPLGS